MADFDPAQDAGHLDSGIDQGRAPFSAMLNVLGAAASLGLIAGIGFWGYQLVMRDVSGVPVVRAIDGPMRIQPDNPGGRPADHQGLAVNAVAAKGSAEATADRLALAPRPVDLLAEDKPLPKLKEAEEKAAKDAAEKEAAAKKLAAQDAGADSDPSVDDFKTGSVQSLVNQLIAEVMPEQAAASGPKIVQARARVPAPGVTEAGDPVIQSMDQNADEQEQAKPELIAAVLTGPGLSRSLRPQPRPAVITQAAMIVPAPRVLDVDPDSLPAGTRLAQLGAFESAEVAIQEWDRLSAKFSDYLGDKSRVIQKASSGGRTFYRLRALGFEDLGDARRFCSVLVAERADCIPVTTR